jgi:protein ImuB
MERMACVDLPALPLQLLLRKNPDWAKYPIAVVDHDRPQGLILWINNKARTFRITPGMRYAGALSLAGSLHAAEVPVEEIREAVSNVSGRLRYFTPHVEPSRDEPGVFWLDASGLDRLQGCLKTWGELIRSGLKEDGYHSSAAVGFSRFGTYALAKGKKGMILSESPEEEDRLAREVGSTTWPPAPFKSSSSLKAPGSRSRILYCSTTRRPTWNVWLKS